MKRLTEMLTLLLTLIYSGTANAGTCKIGHRLDEVSNPWPSVYTRTGTSASNGNLSRQA